MGLDQNTWVTYEVENKTAIDQHKLTIFKTIIRQTMHQIQEYVVHGRIDVNLISETTQ